MAVCADRCAASLHCNHVHLPKPALHPPSLPPSLPPCPSGVVQTHLWLLIIGWGVLVPVGIVIARCFKELDPLWFKLHRCDALTPAGLACHS
jgi:hypothetical protein